MHTPNIPKWEVGKKMNITLFSKCVFGLTVNVLSMHMLCFCKKKIVLKIINKSPNEKTDFSLMTYADFLKHLACINPTHFLQSTAGLYLDLLSSKSTTTEMKQK